MRIMLAFMVAYLGSRALFAAFDFDYAVFSDPFDVGKLILDFGVFAVLFGVSHRLFGFKKLSTSKNAS